MDEAGGPSHPYGFPFRPYGVQLELMDALTEAIDSRAIALLESPTGTGKTLSLICATMAWLTKHRLDPAAHDPTPLLPLEDTPGDAAGPAAASDEPDWVLAHVADTAVAKLRSVQDRRALVFASRVRSAHRAERSGVGTTGRKFQRLGGDGVHACKSSRTVQNDAWLLLDDSPSTPQADCGSDADISDVDGDKDGGARRRDFGSDVDKDIEPDIASRLRIVFATRTHTQLSQFVGEIRKTKYAAAELSIPNASSYAAVPLSVVSFGSRKVMCINDSVRNLPTSTAVADRCHELVQASSAGKVAQKRSRGTGSRNGCPHKNEIAERAMRDAAIVHMQDVEELSAFGLRVGGCPYFSARSAISSGAVDVIGVPYSAVLHQPTRDALGLKIDDKTIVVFDEAHNIVSSVADIHSSVVSTDALKSTRSALLTYRGRYLTRLAPRSTFAINQIIAVLDGLLTVVPEARDIIPAPKARVITPSALIFEAKIDNLNMFALSAFALDSRLFQKLLGFVDAGSVALDERGDGDVLSGSGLISSSMSLPKINTAVDDEERRRQAKHGVAAFQSFLQSLNSTTENGRIAILPPSRSGGESTFESAGRLKYFVLHPGSLFSSAVGAARSVLLIGGTLSPRQAMKDALLAQLSANRPIREFECDHVTPAKNLLAVVAGAGPSGVTFEFTHRTRQSVDAIDDLGRSVIKLAGASPGGVVLFFASYAFMMTVLNRWNSTGCRIELDSIKPMFTESRGNSLAWLDYSAAVDENILRGAILTAVMGGRLSEGINFSDDLGRVVIVVGMPFANANDVETAEVLRSLRGLRERSEYLENRCMTVVNQAIGRAIRHRGDYASIILCDRRFARPSTVAKLPRFVRQSMGSPCVGNTPFARIHSSVARFFEGHR
jgi:chromosome transmission fidelity protein 1